MEGVRLSISGRPKVSGQRGPMTDLMWGRGALAQARVWQLGSGPRMPWRAASCDTYQLPPETV